VNEKPTPYLPTAVGDTRVFEVTDRGKTREVVERVTTVDQKGGLIVVGFSREGGDPASSRYAVSADGVFKVSVDELTYDPPHPILKLPLKGGETWEWTEKDRLERPIFKYKCTTGNEEEVKTPAGPFRAVRVEKECESNGAVLRTTYWHARGAGLVKTVCNDKKEDWVQSLKSFTPAAK
jgi:hypothetical protein